MAWRYFYSTDESDTALQAILDAAIVTKNNYTRNENGLTDGVIEYKSWIEKDTEYMALSQKIDDAKIRALASPERVIQFGNIKPDNFFDSTKYAVGCSRRDTDTLAMMILFLKTFPTGTIIAQRDLDIQGTASLGTVALTLSSLYKKTYNIPVNGSVSDRTLVKATIDSTTPAVTQTNATCNQAMFDFEDIFTYQPKTVSLAPYGGGTAAAWITAVTDKKVSTSANQYQNQSPVVDFGEIINNGTIAMVWFSSWLAGGTLNLYTSTDNLTWSSSIFSHAANEYTYCKLSGHTFRYLKIAVNNNYAIYCNELYAYL